MGTKRIWALAAALVAALAGTLTLGAAGAAAQRPTFDRVDCWVPLPEGVRQGRDVRCGYVSVPLDHSQPEGEQIRIAVAVLRAGARRPEPDPVMLLSGGPGEKLVGLISVLEGPRELTGARDRDVILFDQRGVGFSRPALECPEVFGADAPADPVAAFGACRDRLATITELEHFNTAASASDLPLIRRALGYRKINVYGTSYGSYLGLAAMGRDPGWIRSVILSSPAPPVENYVEDLGTNYRRSLKAVSAACAADRACASTYPRLGTALAEVLGRLSIQPAPIRLRDPATGRTVVVPLTDEVVTSVVFSLLYSAEGIGILPALVAALQAGDYSAFASDALLATPVESPISLGMQLSVQCAEVIPRTSPQEVLRRSAGIGRAARTLVFSNPIIGLPAFDVCERWAVPERTGVADTVSSRLPALVVTGRYDPVTPPGYGRRALRTLPNGFLVAARGAAHSPLLGLGNCGERILQRFLDKPGRRPAAACARRPIEFIDVTASAAGRRGLELPPLPRTAPPVPWPAPRDP